MAELEDAADAASNALQEERHRSIEERITGAPDQDVDDWISWVQKILVTLASTTVQIIPPPGDVGRWPASPLRVSMERFFAAYKLADDARREELAADHRRSSGIFRGYYSQQNREGVTATHETVWGLVSFFESSANARRALQEGAKWSGWASADQAYWARKLSYMHGPRKPVALGDEEAVAKAANRVSASIRHAHAYFDAAQRSPNTVRPNLLYYGCLALAKALVWASFEGAPARHGLSAANRTVWIRPDGEFAAFHDVVCTVPEIYAGAGKDGRRVELDALLANVGPLQKAIDRTRGQEGTWSRAWIASGGPERRITDMDDHQVLTHALAVDFMVLFFLSHWSRYDPVAWEEVLRGEKSGEVHIYLTFLDHIALDFPLQIANYLMGVRNVFTPAMSDKEFKAKVNKVLGDSLRGL